MKAKSSERLFSASPSSHAFAFSLLIMVTSGSFTEMSVPAQRPDPALDLCALASLSHSLCPGTQPAAHGGKAQPQPGKVLTCLQASRQKGHAAWAVQRVPMSSISHKDTPGSF